VLESRTHVGARGLVVVVDHDDTVGVGHDVLPARAVNAVVRAEDLRATAVKQAHTVLVDVSATLPLSTVSLRVIPLAKEGTNEDERPTRMLYVLLVPEQHLSQLVKR
jgi:hypothetical protein